MTAAIVTVLAFSLLFVLWGTMRPMDRGQRGCHGCSHGDDPAACGDGCALFEDLASKPKAGAER